MKAAAIAALVTALGGNVTVPAAPPVPTVREYHATVLAAATPGTRRTHSTYWNLLVRVHGDQRIDELPTSDLRALAQSARANAVKRRNGQGGASAEENCVAALPDGSPSVRPSSWRSSSTPPSGVPGRPARDLTVHTDLAVRILGRRHESLSSSRAGTTSGTYAGPSGRSQIPRKRPVHRSADLHGRVMSPRSTGTTGAPSSGASGLSTHRTLAQERACSGPRSPSSNTAAAAARSGVTSRSRKEGSRSKRPRSRPPTTGASRPAQPHPVKTRP